MLPPEINEANFQPSQISPTEINDPQMEIVFLKNNLDILTRRFNMLVQILEITHGEVTECLTP